MGEVKSFPTHLKVKCIDLSPLKKAVESIDDCAGYCLITWDADLSAQATVDQDGQVLWELFPEWVKLQLISYLDVE